MISVLLSLLACSAGTRTWTISDLLSSASLSLTTGEVRVVSEARTDAELVWEGASAGLDGPPAVDVSEGALQVSGDCEACAGSVQLSLPVGVPLVVRVDTGEVNITLAEPTDVSACVVRGSMDIAVPAGPYALTIESEPEDTTVEGVEHESGAEFALEACVEFGDLSIHGE